jgi:hypothetical protein
MNFTEETEELLKFLMSSIDKFSFKKSPLKQKKIDNILKMMYFDIKNANMWANAEKMKKKIKTDLIESVGRSGIKPSWAIEESKYIPSFIQDYLIENNKGYVIYRFSIGDRDIEIYFGLLNNNDLISCGKFDNYVLKMMTWLKIALAYAPDKCSRKLKIYVYLTPFKKTLPGNQFHVLSQNHCNSAVTISCSPDGEIIIYRKEEFFKVFIHETFHTLGLDFSTMALGKFNECVENIFPIKSEYNLFEAYSEFWAAMMNIIISSYLLLEDKSDEDTFYLYCEVFLRFEHLFSLFQLVKILDFMGLQYENLYSCDKISLTSRRYLFKERTNVFAYYIIKALLLYNNSDFLLWCKKYNKNIMCFNKSPRILNHFLDFIKDTYNNRRFLLDISKMGSFLNKTKGSFSSPKHNLLTKTMRMTICEIK